MSIRIIVDSSSDILPHLKDRVSVIPLPLRFGDEEYLDGVTINHFEFYRKLSTCDQLPATSQAAPGVYTDCFDQIQAAGDSAVVILISSTLSGTYQTVRMLAQEYENIYVVDSRTAALGGGILVERAVQLLDLGYNAQQIADTLEMEREKVRIIALLDTLEYLKKGGRISPTVAFVGGMLSIKPLIGVQDGVIGVLSKARGNKQGNQMLTAEIEKCGIDTDKPIIFGFSGLSDDLLRKYLSDSEIFWGDLADVKRFASISSVIGAHIGPGAVGVAFFTK